MRGTFYWSLGATRRNYLKNVTESQRVSRGETDWADNLSARILCGRLPIYSKSLSNGVGRLAPGGPLGDLLAQL
jgi:hypothetical protein